MIEQPAEKMKKLLADYASKKITMEQLDTECAYWYLDCLDELRVKPLPTAPKRYQDYLDCNWEEKKSYNQNFWQITEIKDYLDQKELIEQENKDNLFNLKKWLAIIPTSDSVARAKYQEKINDFESKYIC